MSDEITPITREETYLNAISEGGESGLSPITREEIYLSAIAGESDLPADMTPITRREMYLQKIYDNGGGGGGGEAEGTVEINITQNGTITRNVARYASAEITTNVPNSYEASDEGKVVSNGVLASQTSRNVTANGTYDTTVNDEVVVNVPTGITPSGTKQISITENGTTTEDVTNYANAEITVNVQSSGGGIQKAEGTATLSSDGNFPTIVHNLGTKKVAVIIYPLSDVVPHGNYRSWTYECVNYPAILNGETFNLDFRQYNSSKFPDIVQVGIDENRFRIANGMSSPATSQTNWYQGSFSSDVQSTVSFTDNSIDITGSFASATYKWIVYALE